MAVISNYLIRELDKTKLFTREKQYLNASESVKSETTEPK